jgi:hypothetical protein
LGRDQGGSADKDDNSNYIITERTTLAAVRGGWRRGGSENEIGIGVEGRMMGMRLDWSQSSGCKTE